MSFLESHPLAVGLLLFGFAYLNSRASTLLDTRAAHRESQSDVPGDVIGKRHEF